MWEVNEKARKITPAECSLGQLRRIINCITVAGEDDKYVYCGTTTGDVLQVSEYGINAMYHTETYISHVPMNFDGTLNNILRKFVFLQCCL